MSALYVFGRRQDLAFEREVGSSASQRHHVRWWRSNQPDPLGRPLWLGAVSFDCGVGFSHRTGQITHHIDPDLDAERNQLMANLEHAGQLVQQDQQPGVSPTRDGRNAGGDRYFTDGLLSVGVLLAEDGLAGSDTWGESEGVFGVAGGAPCGALAIGGCRSAPRGAIRRAAGL